jgi:hypothetical protein
LGIFGIFSVVLMFDASFEFFNGLILNSNFTRFYEILFQIKVFLKTLLITPSKSFKPTTFSPITIDIYFKFKTVHDMLMIMWVSIVVNET